MLTPGNKTAGFGRRICHWLHMVLVFSISRRGWEAFSLLLRFHGGDDGPSRSQSKRWSRRFIDGEPDHRSSIFFTAAALAGKAIGIRWRSRSDLEVSKRPYKRPLPRMPRRTQLSAFLLLHRRCLRGVRASAGKFLCGRLSPPPTGICASSSSRAVRRPVTGSTVLPHASNNRDLPTSTSTTTLRGNKKKLRLLSLKKKFYKLLTVYLYLGGTRTSCIVGFNMNDSKIDTTGRYSPTHTHTHIYIYIYKGSSYRVSFNYFDTSQDFKKFAWCFC